MPKVHFSRQITGEKIKELFEKALNDTGGKIKPHDRIAVKVHFGEQGNTKYVSPENVKPVLDCLAARNENFYLTDANTLYRGKRMNARDHLKIAEDHGFFTLGVPIIIADGDEGRDEETVLVNRPIFRKVRIAGEIARSDALVAVSHVKGHMLFGFGGAIKNIGMGSGSRAGKLEMHAKIKPSINSKCVACGRCVEFCPADAISQGGNRYVLNQELCQGCATCIAVCEHKAVEIPWSASTGEEVQERCAEYAFGAVKGKTVVCINFMNHITKDCDCMSDSRIIGQDTGVVASVDPVACDQASYDLIRKKHRKDIFQKATKVDGTHILEYSQRIGLGIRCYHLVET